jgi:hypothetical protein
MSQPADGYETRHSLQINQRERGFRDRIKTRLYIREESITFPLIFFLQLQISAGKNYRQTQPTIHNTYPDEQKYSPDIYNPCYKLDIKMPVMDGIKALGELKKINPHIQSSH